MEFVKSEIVENLISSYPSQAADKLNTLRSLIEQTAEEQGLDKLVETTKWGEPSYVSKGGSTIRMDWKERAPDKYYMYFICTTELVSTFKLILGDELIFHGNRAIELDLNEPVPQEALKQCISLALRYHKVKHLPMLGA